MNFVREDYFFPAGIDIPYRLVKKKFGGIDETPNGLLRPYVGIPKFPPPLYIL